MRREYYIVIYKDETIEILADFKNVSRLDLKMIFHAAYSKKTPKHIFYYYIAMNAKGVAYKSNSFNWNGIKCKFNRDEFWGVTKKGDKGKGVILSMNIKDKLGIIQEKRFHNYDNKLGAFKTMFKYLALLNRVGTHQGAQEVYMLWKEINVLKRKLKRLET